MLSRRVFMRDGAFALVSLGFAPSFLTRTAFAQGRTLRAKQLIAIFQRGAVDGLNMVVPWREPNYYAMRPTIAIPQQKVLDLDGFFGLHPAMTSLSAVFPETSLSVDPLRSSGSTTDEIMGTTLGTRLRLGILAEASQPLRPEGAIE